MQSTYPPNIRTRTRWNLLAILPGIDAVVGRRGPVLSWYDLRPVIQLVSHDLLRRFPVAIHPAHINEYKSTLSMWCSDRSGLLSEVVNWGVRSVSCASPS